MAQPTPNDTRRRVSDYRARLRAFRKQAHLQSLAVSRSRAAEEDQTFVDAITDWCTE